MRKFFAKGIAVNTFRSFSGVVLAVFDHVVNRTHDLSDVADYGLEKELRKLAI